MFKSIGLPTVGCVLMSTLVVACQSNCTSGAETLCQAISQFTLAYYQRHIVNNTDNVVFSPFSLSMALTMLDNGARTSTANQIDQVLGYGKELCPNKRYGAIDASDDYNKLLSSMKERYSSCNGSRLDVANVVLVQKKYPILEDYVKIVRDKFMAKTEEVDFRSEKSLETVNEWVKNSTDGKITSLVEKIDVDTRLILASAVYFRGRWSYAFDKEKTKNMTFHNLNGKGSKQIPMMFQEANLNVSMTENTEGRFLELPYADNDTSMVLISPKKDRTLSDLESSLTSEILTKALQQMTKIKVKLTMPKFKLASTISAKDTLIEMGMVDAFGQADLKGISKFEGLTVSSVTQKTVVEVCEKGTTAASATEVTSLGRSLPRVEEFVLDHPFLFVIRHLPSNVILFLGRVAQF